VTPEQIEAYVQVNPRIAPERRRVRIIEARDRAQAKRALAALKSGLTWRTARSRYSERGGRSGLEAFEDHPRRTKLRRAVFEASAGEPTRYGRHVFKVIGITPARPAPLDEQRATAWEVLASRAQEMALRAFATDFRAKWLPRTICAQAVATHEDCGNSPIGE
jgi:hypothetical protein